LSLEVKKSSQEVGGIRFFVEDIKSKSGQENTELG